MSLSVYLSPSPLPPPPSLSLFGTLKQHFVYFLFHVCCSLTISGDRLRQKSWSPSSVLCVSDALSFGVRPRYSLFVDKDVKKPTNQPTNTINVIHLSLPLCDKVSLKTFTRLFILLLLMISVNFLFLSSSFLSAPSSPPSSSASLYFQQPIPLTTIGCFSSFLPRSSAEQ